MRNLFLFLWKYHLFILFLILEIISMIFIIRNNSFHRASFVNSTNSIAAGIYEMRDNITDYLSLHESNEILVAENARLRALVPNTYNYYSNRTYLINDTIYRQQYLYAEAKVINVARHRGNNYITLNKGKKQGVSRGMAVISPSGIVGIIKDVSDNYSAVMTLLHSDFRARIKIKSSGARGFVVWRTHDPRTATVIDVSDHINLTKGDTIITSGASAKFPEGVPVGTIEDFEVKPGENFYTIKIKLFTDFETIDYAYVVKNLLKEEQLKLEEQATDDQ